MQKNEMNIKRYLCFPETNQELIFLIWAAEKLKLQFCVETDPNLCGQ